MEETLLNLENVSYETISADPLHNISFALKRGENAIIFGPEHSGIETLFMIILDLDETFKGNIYYHGRSIKDFNYVEKHNYKKDIGYVHGRFGMISNMSVEDNISLPLQYHSTLSDKEIKRYVDGIVFDLNLDHCKKLRPVDLSNSEMLRASYARAIALDPHLLLIEHAFEGQSSLNIQSFLSSLREYSRREDVSVVIITYEPDKFIDFSDRYLMLFNGRLVFDGTREDFSSSQNSYLRQYKDVSMSGPMAIL